MSAPFWIAFLGLVLWFSQHLVARENGWETGREMRRKFPNESILPLLWHGGIWYDLPLTFWLAWLAAQHPEWTWWQWMVSLAIGFTASLFMHLQVYAPATKLNDDPNVVVTQEAHVQNCGVTLVGWLHHLFFGMMLGVILNEILFSKDPSEMELVGTGIFLVGLLFVGNHMILGIVKMLTGKPAEYRGKPLTSIVGWATIIGGAVAATLVVVARTNHIW